MRSTARYWLPLLLGTLCLVVAFWTGPVLTYVLIIVAFSLIFEAATAMFARAGGTGSLRDFRQ